MISAIIKKKKSLPANHIFSYSKPVSVIICAKNEAANLQKNLPFILNQKYKEFEVIVVDDNSTDLSRAILEEFSSKNSSLRVICLKEKIGLGKKYALQKGIEAAANELVLLTDADCKPVSESWIADMASCITDEKKIVLGVSPYYTENTFLNALIEYETAQTALQYLGFAIAGNPYMSVGRNVMYDKELWLTKKWTTEELAITSGDDDLAIQTLATAKNTTVCLYESSYTNSEAKTTWKTYVTQKLRHYQSSELYSFSHKVYLGLYASTKILMYFAIIFSFLCIIQINVLYLIYVIAYIPITYVVNTLLHKTLKIQKRWYYSLILDLIYCTFLLLAGFLSLLRPTKEWK